MKEVKLTWSVSQQINNDKFIIEFSRNGIDFTSIGSILGERNSNRLQTYTFSHKNPVEGNNYYRIQQLDYDGRYDYSDIANVTYISDEKVLVYPNPASYSVTLNVSTATSLTVKDFYGRVFKSTDLVLGENSLMIDDLAKGVYILEFGNGQVENLIRN